MADSFDPYHRWLGISPKHQPPNHYRLLGLEEFETDPEVIHDSAERQISHVKSYELGQHAQLAQTILTELAKAKACLTNQATKLEYDDWLLIADLAPPEAAKSAAGNVDSENVDVRKVAQEDIDIDELLNGPASNSTLSEPEEPSAKTIDEASAKTNTEATEEDFIEFEEWTTFSDQPPADSDPESAQESDPDSEESSQLEKPILTSGSMSEPVPPAIYLAGVGFIALMLVGLIWLVRKEGSSPSRPGPDVLLAKDRSSAESGNTVNEVNAGTIHPQKPAMTKAKPNHVPGTSSKASPLEERKGGAERSDNRLNMKLVWCPAVKVRASESEKKPGSAASGKLKTPIAETGFWLGKYEVTQYEWERIMGTSPWKEQDLTKEGATYPATFINYSDASEFCRRFTTYERSIGKITQTLAYSLPSREQWEAACQAGATSLNFGKDQQLLRKHGWFRDNTYDLGEAYPHQVGQKQENAWKLHDMYGNVDEWCLLAPFKTDHPTLESPPETPSAGLVCGGNWMSLAEDVQAADGRQVQPSTRLFNIGFRVLLGPAKDPVVVASKTDAQEPSPQTEGEDSRESEIDEHAAKTLNLYSRRSSYFSAVRFSPDGQLIAGLKGDAIAVWSASTGELLYNFDARNSYGTYFGFGPESKKLLIVPASYSRDRMEIKGVKAGEDSTSINISGRGTPKGFKWVAGGRGVFLVGNGGISGYNVQTTELIRLIAPVRGQARIRDWCLCGDISPDERFAVTGGDGLIVVWDLSRPSLTIPPGATEVTRFPTRSRIIYIQYVSDTQVLTCTSQGQYMLWDLVEGKPLKHRIANLLDQPIRRISFSNSMKRIALISDSRLLLWNLVEDQLIKEVGPASGVLAISPDGKFVIIGDSSLKLLRLPD